MLETFLGSEDFHGALSVVPDTPHDLQIRRNSLEVCNLVMGHLPGYPIRMEEVYRAQNIFCLRALLLRSLQEVGEWEDLTDGIEIGINALTPPTTLAGSVRPEKATLDDLLLQTHGIVKSICDISSPGTSSEIAF
jgi:hypothetical protein